MTEEINATQEVMVFVPLFKNVYENAGKKFVSYKPWFVSKEWKTGTFPVGLGAEYENTMNGDYQTQEYVHKFWLSVAMNDAKSKDTDPDIYVTLNKVDTKEYKKIGLYKTVKEGKNGKDPKVSYSTAKPVEVALNNYWINLTKNTKKEKPQELNLIFKEAGESTGIGGSEKEILFDELDF